MRLTTSRPRLRAGLAVGAIGLAAAATSLAVPATAATAAVSSSPTNVLIKSAAAAGTNAEGLPDGAIKHVWLIIEENKSYDATFTGLNKNSYLWQTLPSQGVLLKNYYGTGHFSQDNYESLVSGQAPEQDTQSDCDKAATNFSSNSNIVTTGTPGANLGQAASTAGPNAADGKNGCVYPSAVPTLFNQLDAAGKTWKGYAQDLGAQPGRDDGTCGYPGTATNSATGTIDPGVDTATTKAAHTNSTPLNAPQDFAGVRSFTGTQSAGNDAAGNPGAKEDGYVAKHFPFPWFHSLTDQNVTTPVATSTDPSPKDCDSSHIANLDSTSNGLYHDLQSEVSTPNFSWITPNNCSDAHDATCKGNNLSGAFNAKGEPNYYGVTPNFDPQNTKPTNYTGGLYASDLFLKWYIPLIEQSPAFKDGGLIDVTFDEGNPPFAGSSFNNANDPGFAANVANSPDAGAGAGTTLKQDYLAADAAGENLNGQNVNYEPTGPNTPFTQNASGSTTPTDANSTCPSTQPASQPCPGPGDNGFIDRTPSGSRTDGASAAVAGSSANNIIADNNITAVDPGRTVAGTNIPPNAFVGPVSDVGPQTVSQSVSATGGSLTPAASAVAGSFQLVDANGNPLSPTGPVTSVSLGAQTTTTDPIYDATDQTRGGGDTGSVLISPYILPGTSSTTFYNHYSWLRTMEDLFDVSNGSATTALSPGAGTISTGLDGAGHIGYAAQGGLAPFGTDVFNNPSGNTPSPGLPATLPELGLAVGLPVIGLVFGGALLYRRRRSTAGSLAA